MKSSSSTSNTSHFGARYCDWVWVLSIIRMEIFTKIIKLPFGAHVWLLRIHQNTSLLVRFVRMMEFWEDLHSQECYS